jgi:hypothetical protein
MTSKDSRNQYCRYVLDGVLEEESKYEVGNPTYFALPEKYSSLSHEEDNLFHSIDSYDLMKLDRSLTREARSKIDNVTEYILDIFNCKINSLRDKIQSG